MNSIVILILCSVMEEKRYSSESGDEKSVSAASEVFMDLDNFGNIFSHEGSSLYLRLWELSTHYDVVFVCIIVCLRQ